MISSIFNTFFYNPIYNGLVFFIDIIPGGDVGIAIVLITIVVKLILFPLSKKAVRTQILSKQIQPELDALKKKYEKDKQQQAQKMMLLYKEKGINPFSGLLLIFIQLPVILALYWVFFRGGLPVINTDILYSFIPTPTAIETLSLGFLDVTGKSIVVALLAGITQYFQIKLTLPEMKKRTDDATMKEDLARSFQMQMRYVMPIFVTGFAYFISTAIALYWLTSNLFAIGQEMVIRKQVREKEDSNEVKEVKQVKTVTST